MEVFQVVEDIEERTELVGDVVYATIELARAACDKLNAKNKSIYDKSIERARVEHERSAVEHEALKAAGLRGGTFRKFSPVPFRPNYRVEGIHVVTGEHEVS